MEDGAPSLGFVFDIETTGSIAALGSLGAAVDQTHDEVKVATAGIERAIGNMVDTGRATAQIIEFGSATTREMRRATNEKKKLEDARERMIRQLDREAAALGKTRDELRDTRVEELALHAAKLGNLELADRLLASSRGRQAASDAAAEAAAEKKVAEERARVLEVTRRQAIAERELIAEQRRQNDILAERANIEVALERTTGVGRVRATDAGASIYALSKMLIEEEAAALRAAAHAHELFEARVRQGVQAMREQAEAARAAGVAEKQLATDAQMLRSAMDPMYAAQVRFDDELQRAERLLAAGVFGQKEYAQSVQMSRDALHRYAIANELAEIDPSTAVRHALSAAPIAGEQLALITLDDARELLAASTAAGGPAIVDLASRFLALTAVRQGTLRGMRWDEVEGLDWTGDAVGPAAPVWRVPAARMKLAKAKKGDARFDHLVPLSRQAVEILRIVRAFGIDADLVFGRLSESAIGALYRKAGFAGRHVPHGWRATFSTILNERFPAERVTIDRALAHAGKKEADVNVKVEGAYNRSKQIRARRRLMQIWADLLFPVV